MNNKEIRRKRQLKELSWLEIVHIFANLMCINVTIDWHGDFDGCKVEFTWNEENALWSSGYGVNAESPEESSRQLLKQMLYNHAIGPYKDKISFPKIIFDSKEELQMKLEIAGCDLLYMISHRCGG